MKLHVKPKAKSKGHDIKSVRVEFPHGGGPGATVHVAKHPQGMHDYSPEENVGSFGSREEAMHHAAQCAGCNSDLEEAGDEPIATPPK